MKVFYKEKNVDKSNQEIKMKVFTKKKNGQIKPRDIKMKEINRRKKVLKEDSDRQEGEQEIGNVE